MRKHPDVVALFAIGIALFAMIGVQRVAGIVERESRFHVRKLVLDGREGIRQHRAQVRDEIRGAVREGILEMRNGLRDGLREIRP